MADLIIKPATGDGNKLILQDKAGGAVLTTADSGATIANATLEKAIKFTPTSTAPTATAGQMYFDTTQNKIYIYNGTSWGVIDVHSTKATGGNIFQYQLGNTNYQSHTFYANGTFVAHAAITIDILVVAGGGSGSSGHYGAGAGAGGMRTTTSHSLSAGSTAVTVGAGGAAQTTFNQPGINGSPSSFGSVLSCYGGQGSGYSATMPSGSNFGSGGGRGGGNSNGGSGTSGEGNQGGGGHGYGAGGGGGAGKAGWNGDTYIPGDGGNGLPCAFRTGVEEYYAGGGGGSAYQNDTSDWRAAVIGTGGIGGGGRGSSFKTSSSSVSRELHQHCTPGVPGTGGGGGGAEGHATNDRIGAAGGSCIVIVRYVI